MSHNGASPGWCECGCPLDSAGRCVGVPPHTPSTTPPIQHYPRPCMCPEHRCYPLFQTPAPDFLLDRPAQTGIGQKQRPFAPGESWMCWGVMPEGIVFEYDGDRHENDLRVCMCSPLKGLVAFQENYGDWWAMKRGYHKAIERLERVFPDRLPKGHDAQKETP